MRFCPPGSRWRSAGGPSSGSRSTSSRSRHERANRYAHILSACRRGKNRSEEHTSELQSLMRISYAVFCLKKKKPNTKWKTNKKHNMQYKRITRLTNQTITSTKQH